MHRFLLSPRQSHVMKPGNMEIIAILIMDSAPSDNGMVRQPVRVQGTQSNNVQHNHNFIGCSICKRLETAWNKWICVLANPLTSHCNIFCPSPPAGTHLAVGYQMETTVWCSMLRENEENLTALKLGMSPVIHCPWISKMEKMSMQAAFTPKNKPSLILISPYTVETSIKEI